VSTHKNAEFESQFHPYPLDVTVEDAIWRTMRRQCVETALYWLRRAKAQGIPIPPGCNLTLTQWGGPHRLTLIDFASLCRERDNCWNKGILPPETPAQARARLKSEAKRDGKPKHTTIPEGARGKWKKKSKTAALAA
jgi:hypothetical protein